LLSLVHIVSPFVKVETTFSKLFVIYVEIVCGMCRD
jgi:hypothetical protein